MNPDTPPAIRVVVADDDVRIRRDFATLLDLENDIDVVGLAADGAVAVDLARRLNPDVVVMDVRMPVLDGIAATRALRHDADANRRVLVVTTFDIDEYVLAAVRAGAGGFLVKDRAPEQLADAVRTIAAGDGIVAPRATARLLAELATPHTSTQTGSLVTGLTPREIDVVRLVAAGSSNNDIATREHISRATVKTHVSSILSKLGLSSRVQIVVWAYEHGLTGGPRSSHQRW